MKCFGAQIGKDCKVYPSANIWNPKHLRLGDRVIVGDSVDLYNVDSIHIESDVTISQYAFICTASHDIECPERKINHKTHSGSSAVPGYFRVLLLQWG